MEFLSVTLRFAAGILVGGLVGAVSDNIVGLSSLYFLFQKYSAWQTAVISATIGTFVLSAGAFAIASFVDLEQIVIMLSAFTAMPNYRSSLKTIVLDLTAPVNKFVDSNL